MDQYGHDSHGQAHGGRSPALGMGASSLGDHQGGNWQGDAFDSGQYGSYGQQDLSGHSGLANSYGATGSDFQPGSFDAGQLNEAYGGQPDRYGGHQDQFGGQKDHFGMDPYGSASDPFGTQNAANFDDDFDSFNFGKGSHDFSHGLGEFDTSPNINTFNGAANANGFGGYEPSNLQSDVLDQFGLGGSLDDPSYSGMRDRHSPLDALHDRHSPTAAMGGNFAGDSGLYEGHFGAQGGLDGLHNYGGLDDNLLHRGSPHNVQFNDNLDFLSASSRSSDPLVDSFSNLGLGNTGNDFGQYMDRQGDLSHSYNNQIDPYLGHSAASDAFGLSAGMSDPNLLSRSMDTDTNLLSRSMGADPSLLGHSSSMGMGGPSPSMGMGHSPSMGFGDPYEQYGVGGHTSGLPTTGYDESQAMHLADQLLQQRHGSPLSQAMSHDSSIYSQDVLFSDPTYNYNRPEGAYQDLVFFQNQISSNSQLDEAARQRAWEERVAFESLDDAARREQWRTMTDDGRARLGLDSYWASQYDDPGYLERKIQSGWDKEGYLSASLPISSPVLGRYSTYFSPSFQTDRSQHAYIDHNYLEASDLAAYSNALKYDQALDEVERQRRWSQRLAWEALDDAARMERYRTMEEAERMQMGLGSNGVYAQRLNFQSNYRTYFPSTPGPLQYPLPPSLASVYKPYVNQPFNPAVFQRKDSELAAAYYDLARYSQELRNARNLSEIQRQKLWRERVQWQQLSEASRRARWLRMKEQQKQMLGLGRDRFLGSRYHALGMGYGHGGRYHNPKLSMSLRYALPTPLQNRYRPMMNRNYNMVNRYNMGNSMNRQNVLRNSLANQQLALASKQARLRNLNVAEQKARERASRAILDRADRERVLASGHLTGSKTWRPPAPMAPMRRFGAY